MPLNHLPSRKIQLSLLSMAIVAVSLSPILTRWADVPSLTIATYRMLWATLLTGIINFSSLKELKVLSLRQWCLLALSGISLAVHFWSWMASLELISVSLSTILVSVHPFVVLPLGILLFKEKVTPLKWLGLFLVFVGTIGLVFGNVLKVSNIHSLAVNDYTGVVLALLGAFTVAIYLLLGKHLRAQISSPIYTFVVYFVAAVSLSVVCIGQPVEVWAPQYLSSTNHMLFILMAIIPTLLGHTIFNYLLRWMSASTISIATLGEPVIASVIAMILFKEYLSFEHIIFGVIVLGGIFLTEYKRQVYNSTS